MKQKLLYTKNRIVTFSKDSIDFIFHNKEINGKTFNEFKNEVKQGFTETIDLIDKKLDKIKPNYKESISNFYNKSKNDAIEKISDLKKEIFNKKDE